MLLFQDVRDDSAVGKDMNKQGKKSIRFKSPLMYSKSSQYSADVKGNGQRSMKMFHVMAALKHLTWSESKDVEKHNTIEGVDARNDRRGTR